ncbi:MAG: PHP-associated domain-containing protein [bacterium]
MIKLKSDLHLHTCDDPKDSINHTAKELIDLAAQQGFHVLSITNHDTYTFSSDIENYACDRGILLIPGIEKKIEGKHVLILNANQATQKIKSFEDLRKAKEDEIFVIAPHPFFKTHICLEKKLLENIDLFDAIEYTFFYSKYVNFNKKAVKLAKEKGLPVVGNSDCHVLKYMGICHSIINANSQTVEDIFSAMRKKNVDVVSKPIFFPKLCAIFLTIVTTRYKIKRKRKIEVLNINQEKIIEESYV